MSSFFEQIPTDITEQIEILSRLSYELRENKKELLNQYKVLDADMLLDKIINKELREMPSYDHYLGILILDKQYESARAQLKIVMAQCGKNNDTP